MEQGDDNQIFTSAELPSTQRTLIDLSGSPRIVSSEELRQSVLAVATALRAAGTLPRTSVGLLAERSAAMVEHRRGGPPSLAVEIRSHRQLQRTACDLIHCGTTSMR